MNVQTLIVSARTNLKESQKPFVDIRLQVTQFLIKIRNLVGENRLDDDTLKLGLKSLQSLYDKHLSLPYINFTSIPNHKSGNLVMVHASFCFRLFFPSKQIQISEHFVVVSFISRTFGMEVAVSHNSTKNFEKSGNFSF